MNHFLRLALGVGLFSCLAAAPAAAQQKPKKTSPLGPQHAKVMQQIDKARRVYLMPQVPADVRAKDLLQRMTLDEKIGQMTQLCASSITLDGSKKLDLNTDKIREYITQHHVGSFLSGTGTAQRWVTFVNAMQKVAVTETRLGIPIIFGMDNVHGSDYVDEGTMLPHNLNLACSFNPAIAAEGGRITAIESADLGHHWNFAPVLDVGRSVYWPRLYETFGEDPLVCGTMGSAFTRGFQECKEVAPYKQAACAKHFIGYSQPMSGYDRSPSEIPDQALHEFFVPPFRMAFDAGIKTLMVNSGELNGEPVHGSKKLLTGLLRDKMKFDGVVLTDIKDIMKMVEMHAAAHNEKEATLRAIDAGIDMSMACSDVNFIKIMKELVAEGKITEERINESVLRILKLKIELGLFENPYPRADRLDRVGSKENYESALAAARESMVLLKNEGSLLPLAKNTKLLVVGFAANNRRNINGAWTLEWLGAPESRQPANMKTLFQALQDEFGQANVQLADSAAETPGSPALAKFKEQAARADVIVVTAGETPYSEFKGNMNDLSLDPHHANLIREAQATGKPVILLLFEGRPRVITGLEPGCRAILFAGHPGVGGAVALAEMLSGKTVPSGKLPFTYPSHVGHTVTYYHKASDKYTALYPFGHGLSYSLFTYSNLSLSDSVINSKGSITATVTVTNNGKQAAKEAVLWFLKDEVGFITRPAKILRHFEKAEIGPGQKRSYTFTIKPEHLSYPDEKGTPQLEPGHYTLTVGDQKIRFRLK